MIKFFKNLGMFERIKNLDITKLYNTHIQKPITKHLKTKGGLLC